MVVNELYRHQTLLEYLDKQSVVGLSRGWDHIPFDRSGGVKQGRHPSSKLSGVRPALQADFSTLTAREAAIGCVRPAAFFFGSQFSRLGPALLGLISTSLLCQ